MDSLTTRLNPTSAPDSLFLVAGECEYHYEALHRFENFISELADEYDISRDRPLGIWTEASDLTVFLIAACWRLHIPFVCLNPHEKQAVLNRQMEALQPTLICSGPTKQASPEIHNLLQEIELGKVLKDYSSNDKSDISHFDQQQNAVFGYFFTSGTTGDPKIVPLKRRQMLTAARVSAVNIKPAANHFWLLCMPLHHVGGVSLILRSLLYGSAIYRMSTFEGQQVAHLLQNNRRLAAASLVPTMLKRLLEDDRFTTHPTFQAILLGGGPISPSLLKRCISREIPVIPSYGMTESCAQIAAHPVDHQTEDAKLRSAGQLFAPNEIEIRNEAHKPLSAGQSGHIWLKGPQVFDGYLHESNHTAFDDDGWFNTGDFGRLDLDGNIFIEARRTDLIVTGGENVSPFEVEAALQNIDAIKEAAVFGVPDEEWGQRVVAAVCASTQETEEDKLRAALRKQLPSFKIPKQFIFVDELPRTATGKIKRGELPDLLA